MSLLVPALISRLLLVMATLTMLQFAVLVALEARFLMVLPMMIQYSATQPLLLAMRFAHFATALI